MVDSSFWEEATQQSIVKVTIVSKYFDAWSNVMKGNLRKGKIRRVDKLFYFDLFSGPGVYDDGTVSTALVVLKKIINDDILREYVKAVFNDKDSMTVERLKQEVNKLSGIERLRHKPIFFCDEVGDKFISVFKSGSVPPSLIFLDPWGYKGLSLTLFKSILNNWGTDCIFFFSYRRINMDIEKDVAENNLDNIFGKGVSKKLRNKTIGLTAEAREAVVMKELANSLSSHCKVQPLYFRFADSTGSRTSHYIVFMSEAALGYKIMKDLMVRHSSDLVNEVPNLEFSPAPKRQFDLFPEAGKTIDDLAKMLLNDFDGQIKPVVDIFNEHHIDKPFNLKHYKDALKRLEAENKINIDPPMADRPKDTLRDSAIAIFPRR